MPSPRHSTTSPRSAPKASTENFTSDSTTEGINATWNTANAKLPDFLSALNRNDALLTSTPGLLSVWIRGYDVDSKGRKIVESDKHILFILNNPDTGCTRLSFGVEATELDLGG